MQRAKAVGPPVPEFTQRRHPPGRVDVHFRPSRSEYEFLKARANGNDESLCVYLRRLIRTEMAAAARESTRRP
jgi:hypothetical protein